MLKQVMKKALPPPVYHKLGLLVRYGIPDLADYVLGRRQPMVPPRRMIFIGGPKFIEIGDEFFGHFKKLGHIEPGHQILDIGCGIGRMARPLTGYLGNTGRYEGFDIDESGIKWCRDNISSSHPNFSFRSVDVYNKFYRSNGKIKPAEFQFPYANNSFDFVFATSVFTHMFPTDVARYLSELSRVMKPGGRCLLTFLLWNSESAKLVSAGAGTMPLVPYQDFWVKDIDVPEEAVCLSEEAVFELFRKAGLNIETPVNYGSWCGRKSYLSYQDMIVAIKPVNS